MESEPNSLVRAAHPLGGAGSLVSDAHLAALAIELGATLYSYDNDYARFTGLRWIDPQEK